MIDTKVQDILSSNGFGALHEVASRLSVADLFKPKQRCGIYVFRCANGDYYCGQSVDVTRRYVQHKKDAHADMVWLSFKVVPKAQLNEVERSIVRSLEGEAAVALRNHTIVSIPPAGEKDLDLVISPELQDQWLKDDSARSDGRRYFESLSHRAKYTKKFGKFLGNLAYTHDLTDIIRSYLSRCVPYPGLTEYTFWTASCVVPGLYQDSSIKALFRLNVYLAEVYTVKAHRDGSLAHSFHVTASALKHVKSPEHFGPDITFSDHYYETAGIDQMEIIASTHAAARALLSHLDFIRAAKISNLRLMQKGPTLHGRYHHIDLADWINR